MNNYVVAPLIPSDLNASDGSFTNNVEIYGYLQVDGPITSGDTIVSSLNVLSTIDSLSPSTGSITTAGGLGVSLDTFIGGLLNIGSTANTTSTTTGALIVEGGVGVAGSIAIGQGILVHEGSNAKQGLATLVSGSCTVGNTSVATNSRIFLTAQSTTQPTSVGALFVAASTPSVNFVVRSTNVFDTSIFAYEIFGPC